MDELDLLVIDGLEDDEDILAYTELCYTVRTSKMETTGHQQHAFRRRMCATISHKKG